MRGAVGAEERERERERKRESAGEKAKRNARDIFFAVTLSFAPSFSPPSLFPPPFSAERTTLMPACTRLPGKPLLSPRRKRGNAVHSAVYARAHAESPPPLPQTLDAVYGQTMKVAASMPASAQYRKQLEERVQKQQKLLSEVRDDLVALSFLFCRLSFCSVCWPKGPSPFPVGCASLFLSKRERGKKSEVQPSCAFVFAFFPSRHAAGLARLLPPGRLPTSAKPQLAPLQRQSRQHLSPHPTNHPARSFPPSPSQSQSIDDFETAMDAGVVETIIATVRPGRRRQSRASLLQQQGSPALFFFAHRRVFLQAEDELALAQKMLEWQPWQNLEEHPLPGQWKWP